MATESSPACSHPSAPHLSPLSSLCAIPKLRKVIQGHKRTFQTLHPEKPTDLCRGRLLASCVTTMPTATALCCSLVVMAFRRNIAGHNWVLSVGSLPCSAQNSHPGSEQALAWCSPLLQTASCCRHTEAKEKDTATVQEPFSIIFPSLQQP